METIGGLEKGGEAEAQGLEFDVGAVELGLAFKLGPVGPSICRVVLVLLPIHS